jgi:hypothetical protein
MHRLEAKQKGKDNISETQSKPDIAKKRSMYNKYKPLDRLSGKI